MHYESVGKAAQREIKQTCGPRQVQGSKIVEVAELSASATAELREAGAVSRVAPALSSGTAAAAQGAADSATAASQLAPRVSFLQASGPWLSSLRSATVSCVRHRAGCWIDVPNMPSSLAGSCWEGHWRRQRRRRPAARRDGRHSALCCARYNACIFHSSHNTHHLTWRPSLLKTRQHPLTNSAPVRVPFPPSSQR